MRLKKTFNFLQECRYVIDSEYRLFVSEEAIHSQILGGKYVACAGILKFDENGKIASRSHFFI